MPTRHTSGATGVALYNWYGINAAGSSNPRTSPIKGHPVRDDPAPTATSPGPFVHQKMTAVKLASEMVIFYDGVTYHLDVNPNRLSARHNRKTATNLAFFDGHCQTFPTKDLPGGLYASWVASPGGVFEINSLRNEPAGRPKWILEQQY